MRELPFCSKCSCRLLLLECRMDPEWHAAVQRVTAGLQLGWGLPPDQLQQLHDNMAAAMAPFVASGRIPATAAAAAARWAGLLKAGLKARLSRQWSCACRTAATHQVCNLRLTEGCHFLSCRLAARWPLWRTCLRGWSLQLSSWPPCRCVHADLFISSACQSIAMPHCSLACLCNLLCK